MLGSSRSARSGKSSEFGGRAGAVYYVDQRLSFRGTFAYGQRLAVDSAHTFHENRGTLGATLTF